MRDVSSRYKANKVKMMRDEGLLTWMTGLLMSLPVFSLGVDYEKCQLQGLG
jgi:hypothetical protein